MGELEYPWIREEAIGYLRDLADLEVQEATWLPGLGMLDDEVHFFCDDQPEPEKAVGAWLHDADEASKVAAVRDALGAMIDRYGSTLEDLEYVHKPEWQHVLHAAQVALAALSARPSSASVASLSFPLDVEDGWPPVAVESLPFQVKPEGHVALVPPLFVKDLSVGDVLDVTLDSVNGQVLSWRHTSRSARTTVWLGRLKRSATLAVVLAELRTLGCNTSGVDSLGVYAVEVPESVTIEDVDAVLAHLDAGSVAVAFPSMRHPEPIAPIGSGAPR